MTLALLGAGCIAPAAEDPQESLGDVAQAVVAQGDWTGFTGGQCVHGVYQFYTHRFGIDLLGTCAQPGNLGTCESCGACMIWKSSIVAPDPELFNRYDWGTTMPQTYDIVVYPPKAGTGPGHVACVDHLESSDPGAWGSLYVMDSNYVGYEQMASEVHTVSRAPYGIFRLKSLEGPKNAAPKGYLDSATCEGGVSGWAQDPDEPKTSIGVHVYFDAGPGQPGGVGVPTVASLDRPDLCEAIGSCNHGYALPIPNALRDGNPHPVWAYGIDSAGGTNPQLVNGPITVTCAPPVPVGVKRWITSPSVLDGWKLSTLIDLAHEPDPVIDALPQGPTWGETPLLVQADDGSSEVWLIDAPVRRHIAGPASFDAWHFDWASIQKWPVEKVDGFAEGPALRATPLMVQGSRSDIYMVDDAFDDGMTAGAGGGGTSSGSGGGGASAGEGGGGGDGAAPGSSSACSASSAPARGAPAGLVAGAVASLLLTARRRRRI